MVRVNYMSYDKMVTLSNEPEKIMQESFMMSFFDELEEELPPFKDYLQHFHKSKKTHKVVRNRMQW